MGSISVSSSRGWEFLHTNGRHRQIPPPDLSIFPLEEHFTGINETGFFSSWNFIRHVVHFTHTHTQRQFLGLRQLLLLNCFLNSGIVQLQSTSPPGSHTHSFLLLANLSLYVLSGSPSILSSLLGKLGIRPIFAETSKIHVPSQSPLLHISLFTPICLPHITFNAPPIDVLGGAQFFVIRSQTTLPLVSLSQIVGSISRLG